MSTPKCIAILAGAVLLWLEPALAGPALTVNRNTVNIRADATVQSQRLSVLQRGVEMEELGRKDEWIRVRMPDGREGWIHSALVQEQLIVAGRGVRIRAAGSTSAPPVTMVSRGDELSKLRQQGNWYEVQLADGKKGWISKNYVRPKEILIAPAAVPTPAPVQTEEVETEAPPAAEEEPVPPPDESADEPEPAVQEDPYSAGLQHKIRGNYRAALERFEQVLDTDPGHVQARFNAARMRRELQDYDGALADLYEADEASGGRRNIYLEMGQIYDLKGAQDSARKYLTLYRGEQWTPQAAVAEEAEATPPPADANREIFAFLGVIPWVYAVAGGGAVLALAAMILLLRRDKSKSSPAKKRVVPREDRSKFGQALQEGAASRRAGAVSPGEEDELDRQIEGKWQELRQSAAEFGEVEVDKQGMEEEYMDQVLTHLETLRKALEMQDERAEIYTDIVRLQNMKIEAMNDELRLLRRQRKQ